MGDSTFRRAMTVLAVAGLLLAGCSSSASGGRPPTGTGGSVQKGTTTSTATQTHPAGITMEPVYDAVQSFQSLDADPERLRVRVYPLQRVAGALLLTVDFSPTNADGSAGDEYFNNWNAGLLRAGSLKGASLIDAENLVRYDTLNVAGPNGDSYSSAIVDIQQKRGVTYRIGGFFPDPGPAVTHLTVDLQQAGMIPDVPISSNTTPADGLVTGPPSTGTAAPPPPNTTPTPGDLVVWPVPTPDADAYARRHDIIAKVVGGTVNEGASKAQGLVTVNADVLFAFDSATIAAEGQAIIRRATTVLAAKADRTKPIQILGYTDAKGMPAYNKTLSTQRARVTAAALTSGGTLSGYSLAPEGRGETDPVAPNTLAGGADNPTGRALNRRVEIWYTPKPSTAATATAGVAATTTAARADGATATAPTTPAITMPRASLPGMGANNEPAWFSPQVYPAVRTGSLTLVTFDLTLEAGQPTVHLGSALAAWLASIDLSALQLQDPATKQVYLPAYDRDNPTRIDGTFTHPMQAGAPYRFSVLFAGVPASTSTVSLSLGRLGTASGVPVH